MFQTVYEMIYSLSESTKDNLTLSVGAYRISAIVVIVFYALFYGVMYSLFSVAIYSLMKKKGLSHKWIAFIPVLQFYALIKVVNSPVFLRMNKNVFTALFLTVCSLLYVSFAVEDISLYFIPVSRFLFASGSKAYNSLNAIVVNANPLKHYGEDTAAVLGVVYNVCRVVKIATTIAYVVCLYALLLNYFRYRTGAYMALAIIFSIFLRPIYMALVFAFRNREEKDYAVRQRYVVINPGDYTNSQSTTNSTTEEPFAEFNKGEPFADFTKKEEPFSDFNKTEDKQNSENDKSDEDLFD